MPKKKILERLYTGKLRRKGSHFTDEEVKQAEEKFAESLHLAQLGMFNLLENDVSLYESIPRNLTKILFRAEVRLKIIFIGRTNFSVNDFCRSFIRISSAVRWNYETGGGKSKRKVSFWKFIIATLQLFQNINYLLLFRHSPFLPVIEIFEKLNENLIRWQQNFLYINY